MSEKEKEQKDPQGNALVGSKVKDLSREQLENYVFQLSEQAKQLYNQNQKMNFENLFKRLDYLFMVLTNSKFFDSDFVGKCASEIKSVLDVKKEENNGDKDK
mgnify:FL=1